MIAPVTYLTGWGDSLARLFTTNEEVVAEAARFFHIVPISMYFFMGVMVMTAAFNGSGHTRPPMMVTFLRWLIRLPVAYVLAFPVAGHGLWLGSLGQSMGSTGIYIAMVTANIICAAVLVWLFQRGNWQEPVVRGLGLTTRGYESTDRPALLSLLGAALPGDGADASAEHVLQDCLRVRDQEGGRFVVGEIYGDLIAMGALEPEDSRTAEVKHLRVHPEFQRKGYARSMLREFEQTARDQGRQCVRLEIAARQEAAHMLAQNTGYRETTREETARGEVIHMQKSLQTEEPEQA
jgi:GNAT superfamily N-acetyltransferase